MKELQIADIRALIAQQASFGLFLYTPLCGTCKVISRMLDIVQHTDSSIPLVQANINEMPGLAQEHQIGSVPCLLLCKAGEIVERIYAMRSVDYLYDKLQQLKERQI